MKKTVLLLLLQCTVILYSFGQIVNPNVAKKVVSPITGTDRTKLIASKWVEIFNRPNNTGSSRLFIADSASLNTPIVATEVSVKFSNPRLMLYLTVFCDGEFPTEILVTSESNVTIPGGKICGVRIGERMNFSILLAAISSEIHNNDCKKIFGTVGVAVSEIGVSNTNIKIKSTTNADTFYLFNNIVHRPNSLFPGYQYNNNPVPSVSLPALYDNTRSPVIADFIVSREAYLAGKIVITVTTNLGSEHKSGDLELDYSDNVKMSKTKVQSFNLNDIPYFTDHNLGRELVVGPYQAVGSPQHSPMASGGIFKNFRVHLRIN